MMTDRLAELIEQMLKTGEGLIELQRNEFALKNGVVPSQVSYVIASRFTPQRGYIVESRRGGGGYIRIRKIQLDADAYLMHLFSSLGERLDADSCEAIIANLLADGFIDRREAYLLLNMLSDSALDDTAGAAASGGVRDRCRCELFRHAVLALVQYNKTRGTSD